MVVELAMLKSLKVRNLAEIVAGQNQHFVESQPHQNLKSCRLRRLHFTD
jgi:hypothetical protein